MCRCNHGSVGRLAVAALFCSACASTGPTCRPGQSCWPSPAEWQELRARVGGRLLDVTSPPATRNPFLLQDQVGGTESAGWLDAWTAAPSASAVPAESADDGVAAVRFARAHRLRLAIKGTGHDYLGRSSAAGSLLVWTHRMRQVTVHEAFVGRGCSGAGIPAVSVGAGTRWIEAYVEVTVK